eukprot:1551141-Ditylum_brightwellii.AAC.1
MAYFQEKDTGTALKYFHRAKNWREMGKACFSKKEYDDAYELYKDVLMMLQNVLQDEKHLKILHGIAMAYYREGNYDQELEVLLDVLILAKKKEREEIDLYL